MMATTVARLAGLIYNDMVDTIWEAYWTQISGEVGVFLAAATAFRSFFVSRKHSKSYTAKQQAQRFFSTSFAARFNRKNKRNTLDDTLDSKQEKGLFGLPIAPRPQMTGLQTFIDAQGRSQPIQASSPRSTAYDDEELARLHSSASSKEPMVVTRDVGP